MDVNYELMKFAYELAENGESKNAMTVAVLAIAPMVEDETREVCVEMFAETEVVIEKDRSRALRRKQKARVAQKMRKESAEKPWHYQKIMSGYHGVRMYYRGYGPDVRAKERELYEFADIKIQAENERAEIAEERRNEEKRYYDVCDRMECISDYAERVAYDFVIGEVSQSEMVERLNAYKAEFDALRLEARDWRKYS